MKKSNVVVLALLVAFSIFFLWLWYYLGLNRVDQPLDLVLSIVWWVVVAAAIITIIQVEKRRKEQIRTIYVSDKEIFNSEKGKMELSETAGLTDGIEAVLKNLNYDFTKAEAPDRQEFSPRYIVKTSTIKDNTWEGEVVNLPGKSETTFASKEELNYILAGGSAVPQQ